MGIWIPDKKLIIVRNLVIRVQPEPNNLPVIHLANFGSLLQVTLAQLNQQEQTVRNSVEKLSEVQEQIRDMQRWY